MRKILIIIGLILGIIVVACNDGPEMPTKFYLNKGDSLALVAMRENGFEYLDDVLSGNYTCGVNETNVGNSSPWIVTLEADENTHELRVTELCCSFTPKEVLFPKEMGNLTKLKMLWVNNASRNRLEIPVFENREVFKCPLETLIVVILWANDSFSQTAVIPEPLPEEIGNLAPTLKFLSIGGTNIGGELPESLSKLKDCEVHLNSNLFSGKIPLFVRNFNSKSDISENLFTDIDWRLFTEDEGNIPNVRRNFLPIEVSKEIWATERFRKIYKDYYYPQYYFDSDGELHSKEAPQYWQIPWP